MLFKELVAVCTEIHQNTELYCVGRM